MAGRGVDIKLGGNAEHQTRLELAKLGLSPGDPDFDERFKDVLPAMEARVEEDREKVVGAGGLYIIGTERHESRRIDNQLRGRSGRQGDPGESPTAARPSATSTRPRRRSCSNSCSPSTRDSATPSARRCSRPAGSRSSAPSATSRAGSTTSYADAPAVKATQEARGSIYRCKTTCCGSSVSIG